MLSTDDPNPRTFIGFEIEVTRIVKGTEGVIVGEIVEVFVEYAPPTALDLFTGDRTLADPGTPVVVFAGHQPELGELTAFIPEGFMTACPDGRLLGHAGTQGEWADMDGLQAVLNAAEAATPTTSDPPMTPTTVEDPTATTDSTTAPSPPGSTVLPARPATVTGTVGVDDDGRPGVLDDASDNYYAGMGLHRGDPYVVDASTGQTVAFGSLREGERISVWIDGGCAESFPVQCDVTAIGVHRGD